MTHEKTEEMAHHATISKAGEVDFPLWVKVLAWIVGLCIPIAVLSASWFANVMWDMSERMTRMEAKLEAVADDRYRASEARSAQALLQLQIDRNTESIIEIEDRLGMRSTERRNSRNAAID